MPCSLSIANEISLKPVHYICSVFPQPVLHTSVPIMKDSPLGYKISLRTGNGSVQVRFSSFPLPCQKQYMFWEGQKTFQVGLHVKCDQPGSVGRCVSLTVIPHPHCFADCHSVGTPHPHHVSLSVCIPHPHTVLGGEHWQPHGAGWHSHSAEQVYPNWKSLLSLPVAAVFRS